MPGVAERSGCLSAAGLVVILSVALTIYGAAAFQGDGNALGVKTLSGRELAKDPLQVRLAWIAMLFRFANMVCPHLAPRAGDSELIVRSVFLRDAQRFSCLVRGGSMHVRGGHARTSVMCLGSVCALLMGCVEIHKAPRVRLAPGMLRHSCLSGKRNAEDTWGGASCMTHSLLCMRADRGRLAEVRSRLDRGRPLRRGLGLHPHTDPALLLVSGRPFLLCRRACSG